MSQYFKTDEWNIIEDGFHPENNRLYESIMSLGNGYMGMRGNFEEDFSGDSFKGIYLSGIHNPDKTRVGWWKVGYPEYNAKILNVTNFIGIRVTIDGEILDLGKANIKDFERVLNMKDGYLTRSFTVVDSPNRETKIMVKRLFSIADPEIVSISYSITPMGHDAIVAFTPYMDGDISNEESDEKFWMEAGKGIEDCKAYLTVKSKRLDFFVTTAMMCAVVQDEIPQKHSVEVVSGEKFIGNKISVIAEQNKTTTLYKYVAVMNSRYHKTEELKDKSIEMVEKAYNMGFDTLLKSHSKAWENIWKRRDVEIKGDKSAQQGIRFSIFQLSQTYTGDDPSLNIGPKGFTGEKYGGSTYWDTEAVCLFYYLSTQGEEVSKNLLLYRYNHLEKARENAGKLGLKGALYPMVTVNGEECHSEWEITFEEIHRNAAISHAIFNYVRYTGDEEYLADYGFEVLAEISRFWASRVNYNCLKDKYMILGVTGPNEYENNVNNNWYTNIMAAWNLEYTLEVTKILKEKYPLRYTQLIDKFNISEEEINTWSIISQKMYYPYVEHLGIFEQQDGYMDKEQMLVRDIPLDELPLNQNWSWDRILRSCFIKQADVLQGLLFLNERFDIMTKKRNFDFYEPRTVHESSLSPSVYSIIACETGYIDMACELYLRTARMDLDNRNNDTGDGLHITGMAGAWMSIVYGFAGMKVKGGILSFSPTIPKSWEQYSFKIIFRNHLITITISKKNIVIGHEIGGPLSIIIYGQDYTLYHNDSITIDTINEIFV